MKLYRVHLWTMGMSENHEQFVLIIANSEDDAETKALNNSYMDCAEAEEVTEIDGHKVIFEKIV